MSLGNPGHRGTLAKSLIRNIEDQARINIGAPRESVLRCMFVWCLFAWAIFLLTLVFYLSLLASRTRQASFTWLESFVE
jgi:hypothetical protein